MKKANRHALIKHIIEEYPIETQDDLIAYLEKSEVFATQATISRDIRELSIIKTHNQAGQVRYAIFTPVEPTKEEKVHETIRDYVTKITQVQFINILNTNLGTADVVAALIDYSDYSEIVGSIAGTDTLVIFSPSEEAAISLHQKIAGFIKK